MGMMSLKENQPVYAAEHIIQMGKLYFEPDL